MRTRRITQVLVTATATGSLLVACSGAGGSSSSGGDGESINVLMVGNPQMEDIAELTKSTFTKDTGIKVNFTILPENELRDKVTQDIATQAGQYDVATVGAYEVPVWHENGWLHELDSYADKDAAFDKSDLLKPMVQSLSGGDGKLYALPFYGESSFLMYNKEVLAEKGVTMPERPTWQQVADAAAEVDGARPGMKGICLRGLPGWGELGAPLTTMVNTFGGTWFTKDWKAQVNSAKFKEATNFYVDLVKKHGEAGAPQAGFTECLNAMSQGKVAMWYDATSAAGSLEDPKSSKIAGKVGYAYAPVVETKSSGWLWTWAWAMPKTTKKADAASKFMLWASSKKYEKLVGEKLGWARVPAGKRASTYEIPEYKKDAAAFGDITLKSIQEADPTNPGVQPRPTVGVQFVAVPEFQDLGTKVTQEISAAIAGQTSVDKALDEGQKLAQEVAEQQQ
ncbi:ABC transporter substrate-binding protein [Streptomyces europaeiscabiei]|uniref:ABC transporter substrate-binding protein n=1 Tax=Streptomyces europaeiscabiei TaxID=146819 RepID=UPI0006283756|nr:sugar ABC transporter substrate-binding protein [Streptomyces europaeiscabiei]MDX2524536.1 sugar ABC transporter substrate-binding protein [Streptomyces europaeiscabiei]MDX2760821.1 sugar ABC transporter substrate-binding protein [Streptomyces europaeiscabiei]MDX2769318.1 sugar ABC transporter substrate-binding protein [Streptomyces europaeiscabiei]MDX3672236.1 sugar ABC transporter substrate-binding protein [Streptomyces europaeiscabiei]MDX3710327.1 sugar ABC transporter substrate-binding 